MSDDYGTGISPQGNLAVVWTLAALSTVLLAGRFLIRSVVLHRLHGDDIFCTIAWFLMMVNTIITTIDNPLSYHYAGILVGALPRPSPAEFASLTIELRHWAVASQTLFWTTIYCVKLSFLFLYKLVLGSTSRYRHVWYFGLTYVIVSYAISLIDVFGQCGGNAANLWSIKNCSGPEVTELNYRLLWVDYALNVSSDLLVMLLPMPLIWNLQMRTSHKIAVTGVCALVLITIAFETARAVQIWIKDAHLASLYSYLEFQIAVIVGTLPTYRFVISGSEKNQEYRRLLWTRITLRSRFSSASRRSAYHSEQRLDDSGSTELAIITPVDSTTNPTRHA